MNRHAALALGTILAVGTTAFVLTASSAAFAQSAPTYQADPDVYKIIYEDAGYRVISGTWPKGAHDKPHAHPVASVIYFITDCNLRLSAADGKTVDVASKAGTSQAPPVTPSHSAENIGPAECKAVFVERK